MAVPCFVKTHYVSSYVLLYGQLTWALLDFLNPAFSTSLDRMQDELNALLNGKAPEFLQAIRADKTRYTRDQFRLIRALYDRYGPAAMLEALYGENLCTCIDCIQMVIET